MSANALRPGYNVLSYNLLDPSALVLVSFGANEPLPAVGHSHCMKLLSLSATNLVLLALIEERGIARA